MQINLYDKQHINSGRNNIIISALWCLCICLSGLVCLSLGVQRRSEYELLKQTQNQLKYQLVHLQSTLKSGLGVNFKKRLSIINIIHTIKNDNQRLITIIDTISQALPKNVYLTTVEIEKVKLVVKGYAVDIFDSLKYFNNLLKRKEFANIQYSASLSQGSIQFVLNATIV